MTFESRCLCRKLLSSAVNICQLGFRTKSHLVTARKLSVKVELAAKCQNSSENPAKAKIAGKSGAGELKPTGRLIRFQLKLMSLHIGEDDRDPMRYVLKQSLKLRKTSSFSEKLSVVLSK